MLPQVAPRFKSAKNLVIVLCCEPWKFAYDDDKILLKLLYSFIEIYPVITTVTHKGSHCVSYISTKLGRTMQVLCEYFVAWYFCMVRRC